MWTQGKNAIAQLTNSTYSGQGTELEHNFMKTSVIFLTRLFVDDTGETYGESLFMTVYDSSVTLGNHFSFTCPLIWALRTLCQA